MQFRRKFLQTEKHGQSNTNYNTSAIVVATLAFSFLIGLILYYVFGGSLNSNPTIIVSQTTTKSESQTVPIEERFITVMDNEIYCLEASIKQTQSDDVDILLLHGAKYSSSTWKALGTIDFFVSNGYRTIAIDLPGYGHSKNANKPSNVIKFFESLISSLNLQKLVIIVPSMSGEYGLPLLLENNDIDLGGMVLIAPVGTSKYSQEQYQNTIVPVLFMYGDQDTTQLPNEAKPRIKYAPKYEEKVISNAGHAAYVENPREFHESVLRFINMKCANNFNKQNNDVIVKNNAINVFVDK